MQKHMKSDKKGHTWRNKNEMIEYMVKIDV